MTKLQPIRREQVRNNEGVMYPVSAVQAVLSTRSGAGKQAADRDERLKAAVARLQKSGVLSVQGADKGVDKQAFSGGVKALFGGFKALGLKLTVLGGRSSTAVPAAASAVEGAAAAAPAVSRAPSYASRGLDALGRAAAGALPGSGVDTLAGMADFDTGGAGMLTGGLSGAVGGASWLAADSQNGGRVPARPMQLSRVGSVARLASGIAEAIAGPILRRQSTSQVFVVA